MRRISGIKTAFACRRAVTNLSSSAMTALQLLPIHVLGEPSQDGWSSYDWHFLAGGDSWFNQPTGGGLLGALTFTSATSCAVQAGGIGLRHFIHLNRDNEWRDCVYGPHARAWTAWLLSVGGNDLMDAVQAPPGGRAQHNPALRLLRKPEEWGELSLGPARYLSEPGWQTFEKYMRANLEDLIQVRDHPQSLCRGVPIFLHTYAPPTPRNARGVLGGPWVYAAVKTYRIPITDWVGVAEILFGRLAHLLKTIATDSTRYPHLYVFDSFTEAGLERAGLGETGVSGDWADEMHLTTQGCEKIARGWGAFIARTLMR